MSSVEADNFYLYLSKNPIRFEPVSSVTSVFFDDSNRQVFTVRSNGAAGVVVKGPDERITSTMRLEDRGEIISVKLSSDMRILGVQRSTRAVDFINLFPGADINEYSQTCKGKETKIIGVCWTNPQEIVYVTDHGLEHYQVIPEKKILKLMKTYSIQVNWFIWSVESAVLLVSSRTLGNTLYPFHFKNGTVTKLSKFEVELLSIPKPPQLSLKQRDVTLATVYGQLYALVLRHGSSNVRGSLTASEVLLYQILNDSAAKKTDVLRLNLSGRFALNVVDNLIVVHHQVSKTSLIYDIHIPGESGSGVTYHQPFLSPLPIRPFKLVLPAVPTSSGADVQEYNCELYSPNWVIFQPDIVLDAKLGCFWYLRLNLESIVTMITDKCRLIDFLLLRQDSKMVILNVCRNALFPSCQVNLTIIATIFNKLNRVYNDYLNTLNGQALPGNSGIETNWSETSSKTPIIDQSDMYTHVFSVFDDCKDDNYKFVVAVLIEYLRSLGIFQIPVQHFLFELIINTLVHHNCYYQLHQFLQYHVFSDSKPLACLLLSLESSYPPAYQLALDMLKRLATANDSIIEVLVSKKQLLPAIRFAQSVGMVDQVSARKFLEAAKATSNTMTFFTIFRFFEHRNMRLRGNAKFYAGEHCDPYVEHFKDLFGADALLTS